MTTPKEFYTTQGGYWKPNIGDRVHILSETDNSVGAVVRVRRRAHSINNLHNVDVRTDDGRIIGTLNACCRKIETNER